MESDPVTSLTSLADLFLISNLPYTVVLLSFISNILLFIVVVVLIKDRYRIHKENKLMNEKFFENKSAESKAITEMINKYHEGNLKLVESLTEIKSVLMSIQNNRR